MERVERVAGFLQSGVFVPTSTSCHATIDDRHRITGVYTATGEILRRTDSLSFALSERSKVDMSTVFDRTAFLRHESLAEDRDHGFYALRIPIPLPAGGTCSLTVPYTTTLDTAVLASTLQGTWYEFSCNTCWHPMFTLFDLLPATVEIRLTLPSNMAVVASDAAYSRTTEGDQITHQWNSGEERRLDFAIIAGPGIWERGEHGPVALQALTMPGMPYGPEEIFEATGRLLDLYTRMMGPYPFSRLSIACPPRCTSGNCARDGLVMAGLMHDNSPLKQRGYGILAHEIAHNWWNGAVRFAVRDVGLAEPLAGYCTLRALRESLPRHAYQTYVSEQFWRAKKAEDSGTPVLDCAPSTPYAEWLREWKGAFTWVMLERAAGIDRVDAALRAFVATFTGKRPAANDVRAVFVDAAGDEGGTLFDQYIRGVEALPEELI